MSKLIGALPFVIFGLCGGAWADAGDSVDSAARYCESWIMGDFGSENDGWRSASRPKFNNAALNLVLETFAQQGEDDDLWQPDIRDCSVESSGDMEDAETHRMIIERWEAFAQSVGYRRWNGGEQIIAGGGYNDRGVIAGIDHRLPPLIYNTVWHRCGEDSDQVLLIQVRDSLSISIQSLAKPVDSRLTGCRQDFTIFR